MHPEDSLKNVLYVDLTKKTSRIEHRPELFDESLGGAGVGIRLLAETCPAGADPLGADNVIVFAVGPLTGLYPLASKTVAMFKSPLTGNLGESHCGGRSAVSIRMAGYGAIVIQGASELPLYLSIHGDEVRFHDATTLWGTRSVSTAGRVIRERETGAGLRTIMRIGRAGERLIPYACVTTETYRHFGRLGLGAVFGSKKLKAVTIAGKRSLPLTDMKAYKKIYKEIHEAATASKLMKEYHDLGTPQNVEPLNTIGAFPTRNLQAGRLAGSEAITGEAFAEGYLGRRLACSHCPVGCIHIAALREPHPEEPYFYKTSMISYDYELIYALGGMLGVTDAEGLLKLLDEVEIWGLDAMSAGVCLAWATEAQSKGLVGDKETGGLTLAFGDWATYLEALGRLVHGETPFWQDLSRGVRHAAARYGGTDYALHFGGNEMPGYHTGPACHLGTLVGTRHSHLCNGGYGVDQKGVPGLDGEASPEQVADALIKEEQWRQVLSSLVICFFARKIYKHDLVSRALALTGFDMSAEALDRMGEAIYREKYAYKFREGFSLDDLSFPERIFETPAARGPVDRDFLARALLRVKAYHQVNP